MLLSGCVGLRAIVHYFTSRTPPKHCVGESCCCTRLTKSDQTHPPILNPHNRGIGGEAFDPRFRVGQRHWFCPAAKIFNTMRPTARFMTVPGHVGSDDMVWRRRWFVFTSVVVRTFNTSTLVNALLEFVIPHRSTPKPQLFIV